MRQSLRHLTPTLFARPSLGTLDMDESLTPTTLIRPAPSGFWNTAAPVVGAGNAAVTSSP